MKKEYIKPELNTVVIKMETALLAASMELSTESMQFEDND